MQTTIEVNTNVQTRDYSIMPLDEKKDLIRRAIELNAGEDIWLTHSEIAYCTGMHRNDVIKTMHASGKFFLQSTWRMRNGEILVTIRDLYGKRTPFWEKVAAAFTAMGD